MDSLIAIGSSASLVYGIAALIMIIYGTTAGDHELVHKYLHNLYFESAAVVVALVSVGKYMEASNKEKTKLIL